MPRFNVQHPVTKEWRCFSTVVDDYVTDWMEEKRYQRWRLKQYGKQAGEIRDANLMDYEKAEQRIADRKRWDAEDKEETLKRATRFERIKNTLTIEEMANFSANYQHAVYVLQVDTATISTLDILTG